MKTIFCPLDFSPCSIKAAEWAAMLSVTCKCKLVLFHKIVTSDAEKQKNSHNNRYMEDSAINSIIKLEEIRVGLCHEVSPAQLECELKAEHGTDTDDIISEEAVNTGADMIVMGTSGAASFDDILLGSTTLKVIRQSVTPVLLIQRTTPVLRPGKLLYVSDKIKIREKNFLFLQQFAETLRAQINYVHAMESTQSVSAELSQPVTVEHKTAATHKVLGKEISFELISGDDLYATLQQFFQESGAGLMVLSLEQRNLFERILKGDLTRLMVLYPFSPLLVLK